MKLNDTALVTQKDFKNAGKLIAAKAGNYKETCESADPLISFTFGPTTYRCRCTCGAVFELAKRIGAGIPKALKGYTNVKSRAPLSNPYRPQDFSLDELEEYARLRNKWLITFEGANNFGRCYITNAVKVDFSSLETDIPSIKGIEFIIHRSIAKSFRDDGPLWVVTALCNNRRVAKPTSKNKAISDAKDALVKAGELKVKLALGL